MYSVMSSANSDSFNSSFPNLDTFFFSFSSLISVARTTKTTLNKSGESGHLSLVPDLRGNAFSFSPLNMMLAVSLSYMAFIMLRYVPSIPIFQRVLFLNHKLMLNFVKSISSSIEIIIWFLFFTLLMWCITLIDLPVLKNTCTCEINPT